MSVKGSRPGGATFRRVATRAMRNLLVGAVSVVVVVVMIGYVVGPSDRTFRIDVRSVRLSASDRNAAVVYGRVHDTDGHGLSGVDVSDGKQASRSTTTDADGIFRLTSRPGRRTVRFSCDCAGASRSGEIELDLRPGHAYELDVETDDRGFVVLPVSGY